MYKIRMRYVNITRNTLVKKNVKSLRNQLGYIITYIETAVF